MDWGLVLFTMTAVALFILFGAALVSTAENDKSDYIFEPYGKGFKKFRKAKR